MKSKKIFYINLIYYLCMLAVAVVFVLGYFNVFKTSYLSSFLIQCVIMFAIPIILYSIFISKSVKKTFSDFGFKKISFTILLCSIGLGLVLFFINNYVADVFYTILSIFGYDNSINVALNANTELITDFLLTAILPGICEEVLHRGMFLRGCKHNGYPRYGLLFSSILFGLMHLNIQQCFYAMILGFLMGVVVVVSDSIYPAMIIHFMNNGLNIYFSYGKKYDWPFVKLKSTIENIIYSSGFITCILSLCVCLIVLFALYRLLLKIIIKDKSKQSALKLAKDLKLNDLSYLEVQDKLAEIDSILKQSSSPDFKSMTEEERLAFVDKIFLYSSLVLGVLITICSFIWGIL